MTTMGVGGTVKVPSHPPLAEVSDPELGPWLIALSSEIDRLQAEFCSGLERFQNCQGYELDSSGQTLKSWLRLNCRLSSHQALERVRMARRLPELPLVQEAFQEGRVPSPNAACVAEYAQKLGSAALGAEEATLVEIASHLNPDDFRRAMKHLRHVLDPDGELDDANGEHRRRWLSLTREYSGGWHLEGRLDDEGGEILQTMLDALIVPPTVVDGDGDGITERRADALVEGCRRLLDSGELPETSGLKPHLNVWASPQSLRGDKGAQAPELDWAGPVPTSTAQRIACDCVVVDAEGYASRRIPQRLQRQLRQRDRGCRFPGCDRPWQWCDGHHLQPWWQGGATALWNLVLLCRRHHRRCHEGGWQLSWGEGGVLVAEPP